MIDQRQQLVDWIDADRDKLIDFLSGFVAAASPNPPGDTREATEYLCRFLDSEGLPYRIIAPKEHMPNVAGSFEGGAPGRHLVLNGHIDVFPASDPAGWTHAPWSGALADGKVWGRGSVDMKSGTGASVLTYAYLHRIRGSLKGRLTLTAVSDEETGGKWGALYLIENFPDEFIGDCVLNGEPSSPHTVRFGEKGTFRFTLTVRTPGAHGAYVHRSKSASKILGALIGELDALEKIEPEIPENVLRVLARDHVRAAIDGGLGKGAADILNKVTVNIGVVRGGLKVNMMPGECAMEVDVRLPIGLDKSVVKAKIDEILGRYPEATFEEQSAASNPSNWCDPEHEMLKIITANAEALSGIRPVPVVTLAETDCKFWRYRGVPSYIYGPTPGNMSRDDEWVSVDEYLLSVKTHLLSSYDYLMGV